MKIAVWGVMGLLLMVGSAAAQPKPAGGDEAAIKALEEKWDAANVKGDVAVLDSILGDKFISTTSEGKIRTKAEYVAQLKAGTIKFQTSKVEEMNVYLYGDAAVVNGRWTGKFTEKGKPVSANERFTDTFVRINGQWRCVASQGSAIK